MAAPATAARRTVDAALVLLVLAATALLVQPNTAQSASRLALTAAVAERGTVVIDDYEHTLGADFAAKDGHLYSDKAPAQPLAAVPLWGLYRAVGGEPGTVLRVEHNLGLWWMTFWSSAVPAALLAVAMRRYVARFVDDALATLSAVAFAAGTLLLPFATLLFGHVLAGLLAFTSFLLIRSTTNGQTDARRGLVLAGLAIGAAVAVEYTVAIVGAVLLIAAATTARRRVGWFLLGTVPAAIFLAAYHTIAFGGPLEHPYKYSAFDLHHDTFAGIGAPDMGLLASVLVGDRGLLVLTPVVGVAIAGLIGERRQVHTLDVLVPLSTLALYLAFASSWIDPTGGYSPGPRHLLPAIPFLVGGLALAWARWQRLAVAASVFSAATMVIATLGDPQLPTNQRPALRLWVERFVDGDGPTTLFTPLLGRAGLLVVVALVGAAGFWLRREIEQERRARSPGDVSRPAPLPASGP